MQPNPVGLREVTLAARCYEASGTYAVFTVGAASQPWCCAAARHRGRVQSHMLQGIERVSGDDYAARCTARVTASRCGSGIAPN